MLVSATSSEATSPSRPKLVVGSVLLAVARRGIPNIVEANLVPAALFFVLATFVGVGVAMAGVLLWGYGAIGRRLVRSEPVPALLGLATFGLSIRTLIGLLSGSTFIYFIQPVATTLSLALVFLASVFVGRPVIARMARDFCPMAPDVADRPAVARLFSALTILWAAVHVATAVTTFTLLVSLSAPTFVAVKTVACLGITVFAIAITVLWAVSTARDENVVFARA